MKLLQKTIRSYFIYSVFILLVAIPIFYFVIQNIVTEDVDEELLYNKEMLKPKISDALKNNTISDLKFLDHDITISISPSTKEFDSLWTVIIYDSLSREMVPHRVLTSHFSVNNQLCMLEIKMSMVDRDELIESIVEVQIILLLLLLAGLFIINRNLSRRIWKPFYTSLYKLRKYKVEAHEPLTLEKSSIDEFDDLNTSLEELAERTHKSYISQKEFTENASHEMQTPLAIFQSKVELLMQTSPLNEEQAQLISDLGDASQRMTRLNRSLLLLTKIENNQFVELENVSLQKVITDFSEEYQPQADQKQINISMDFRSDVVLEANKSLIEVMIGNLLGNAIRHNHPGGSINIILEPELFTIINTGKGVAMEEDILFQRFQKDNPDSSGTGLGLEIVKQICNLYGFTIRYEYSEGAHAFIIRLNNFSKTNK